jgi:hypothetical protein
MFANFVPSLLMVCHTPIKENIGETLGMHVPETRMSSKLGAVFSLDESVTLWVRNSKICGLP